MRRRMLQSHQWSNATTWPGLGAPRSVPSEDRPHCLAVDSVRRGKLPLQRAGPMTFHKFVLLFGGQAHLPLPGRRRLVRAVSTTRTSTSGLQQPDRGAIGV